MKIQVILLLLIAGSVKAQVRSPKETFLDTVPVYAVHKPETLVGKASYSIFDFDFCGNKLLLLAAPRSLSAARIELSDYSGKIFDTYTIPKTAGPALRLFHDFEGYTNLVCRDSVFRIDALNEALLVTPITQKMYNNYLLRVEDTLNGNYYFQNRIDVYPEFSYYYLNDFESKKTELRRISNEDLMKIYNMEYYFLPPGRQLEARRLAEFYNADVHLVAAMMSGFTSSLFYDPLYAPLLVVNDTVCIFNHHNDYLYHYSKYNDLIDSVKIGYHHPRKWREWKKQLLIDRQQNKVYAVFSKDGHYYVKRVNHRSGVTEGEYRLKHHSAERMRIRDGYIYYIYRPFESTQERFLYRERIE